MKTRIGFLALGLFLVGCGESPTDQVSTAAPLTAVKHIHVAAAVPRTDGTTFDATYDNTAFSDGSITVTGTVSGVTPGSNTHTFTAAVDGPPSAWYRDNPAVLNAAAEQWTLCLDVTHPETVMVNRQPLGHRDSGGNWIVPPGESWWIDQTTSQVTLYSRH
jgi:hypothetical protein